ncbi:MAG: NPCBM/NEW2 domain-containing protein [Acidimicrobiales bacterium]|nr:NPCBM/NEW2 domain-containing protein [Acidimicrobiales bacterium]
MDRDRTPREEEGHARPEPTRELDFSDGRIGRLEANHVAKPSLVAGDPRAEVELDATPAIPPGRRSTVLALAAALILVAAVGATFWAANDTGRDPDTFTTPDVTSPVPDRPDGPNEETTDVTDCADTTDSATAIETYLPILMCGDYPNGKPTRPIVERAEGWIAVVASIPVSEAGTVDGRLSELEDRSGPLGLYDSRQYLGLRDSYLAIAAGPYPDAAGAEAFCSDLPTDSTLFEGCIARNLTNPPWGLGISMPDLVGAELLEAQAGLDELGVPYTVEIRLSSGSTGEVLETDPAPGETVDRAVRLVVADPAPLLEAGRPGTFGDPTAGPATVNGQLYDKALYSYGLTGITPNRGLTFWEYDLSGGWQTFEATVGVADDSAAEQSARFRVLLDDTEVWTRDLSLGVSVDLELDVSGAKRLRLEAINLGEGQLAGVFAAPVLRGDLGVASLGCVAAAHRDDCYEAPSNPLELALSEPELLALTAEGGRVNTTSENCGYGTHRLLDATGDEIGRVTPPPLSSPSCEFGVNLHSTHLTGLLDPDQDYGYTIEVRTPDGRTAASTLTFHTGVPPLRETGVVVSSCCS